MDKAQEFKRKWNLEGNTGNNSKSQNIVSKTLLISIAQDFDIVGVDGNPYVLDRMISLDRQRSLDNQVESSVSSSTNPGLGLLHNINEPGDKDLTPVKNSSIILDDPLETDQEKGWSKVGPKTKN